MSSQETCFDDEVGKSVLSALNDLASQLSPNIATEITATTDLGFTDSHLNLGETAIDEEANCKLSVISPRLASPSSQTEASVDAGVDNSSPFNYKIELSPDHSSGELNTDLYEDAIEQFDENNDDSILLEKYMDKNLIIDMDRSFTSNRNLNSSHGLDDSTDLPPPSSNLIDDWADDEDLGYVAVVVSEEEFMDVEKDALRKREISRRLKSGIDSWEQAGEYSPQRNDSHSSVDDDDLLATLGTLSSTNVNLGSSLGVTDDGYDGIAEDLRDVQLALGLDLGENNDDNARLQGQSPKQHTDIISEASEVAQVLNGGGFGLLPVPPAPSSSAAQSISIQPPPPPSTSPTSSEALTPPCPPPATGDKGKAPLRKAWQDVYQKSQITGQHKYRGVDGATHGYFNLKVIFDPFRTGFEENKDFNPPKGSIVAGRYEVVEVLGQAAFSTALQCVDLEAPEDEDQWVCLKVIKNNKDFFDQSLDEIKLLQYINSVGDPDENHVVRMIDYFYFKEHLFIVSELLKENLYEFGKYVRESSLEPYFTLARLKKISKQVLEALAYIHSLNLIHCDLKPENIVIKSYSRCEVKLIDFGSSCFSTDHLSTYIQSRSYRAPEVILGYPYDGRIDIWSLGAVIAEMLTGYVLFQNESVATMLCRIMGILGPYPRHVMEQGRDVQKYFTASNTAYERAENGDYTLIFPKQTNLASRLHLEEYADLLEQFSSAPADAFDLASVPDEVLFIDFVREMLDLDPIVRPSAATALNHPWLRGAYDVDFTTVNSIYAAPLPPPAGEEVAEEAEVEEEGGTYEYEEDDDYADIVEREGIVDDYEDEEDDDGDEDAEDEDYEEEEAEGVDIDIDYELLANYREIYERNRYVEEEDDDDADEAIEGGDEIYDIEVSGTEEEKIAQVIDPHDSASELHDD